MNERVFVAYGKRNFVAGSQTNENLFLLEYTGNGKLFLEQMTFSTNSTNAKCEVFFDPTSVSGGTTFTAINVNRGSSQSSETTIINGSSTITATTDPANEILDVRLNVNTFTFDFRGGVILTKGKSVLVRGSVATAADRTRDSVYCFEQPTI